MNSPDIKLMINKQIDVPIEKAYQAWTDPKKLKQWFGPGPELTLLETQVDLKIGGEYSIHMYNPETKKDHKVAGKYEEIIPNKKLVFSWKWEDGIQTTLVTIDFYSKDNHKTLVTLTHTGFEDQEYADKHVYGWTGCMTNLVNYFA